MHLPYRQLSLLPGKNVAEGTNTAGYLCFSHSVLREKEANLITARFCQCERSNAYEREPRQRKQKSSLAGLRNPSLTVSGLRDRGRAAHAGHCVLVLYCVVHARVSQCMFSLLPVQPARIKPEMLL